MTQSASARFQTSPGCSKQLQRSQDTIHSEFGGRDQNDLDDVKPLCFCGEHRKATAAIAAWCGPRGLGADNVGHVGEKPPRAPGFLSCVFQIISHSVFAILTSGVQLARP